MESSGWRKLKMRVENKRHTNAHRPLTSNSPTGVSIPPSPPQLISPTKMRRFVPCYYFSRRIVHLKHHISYLRWLLNWGTSPVAGCLRGDSRHSNACSDSIPEQLHSVFRLRINSVQCPSRSFDDAHHRTARKF